MGGARRIVVFGGSGAIGSALAAHFVVSGWHVTATSRSPRPPAGAADSITSDAITWIDCDSARPDGLASLARAEGPFDAAVWAQGQNLGDQIRGLDFAAHDALYQANVGFVLKTLQLLLEGGKLSRAARLCVISSIWQNIARQNKLSYCITKAALQGLVQACAVDLGAEGHLINAVLPGALDTPMTRANLSTAQIARLEEETPIGRLPGLADVASLVEFLCSAANSSITGQFIAADGGFSHVRKL